MKRQALTSLLAVTLMGGLVITAPPAMAGPDGPRPDVVNGEQPVAGDWPFLASLFMPTSGNYGYFCGGSFVTTTKVVTAAHCFFDENGNRLTSARVGPAIGTAMPDARVTSSSIVIHPDYDAQDQTNDIAVVTLSKAVTGVGVVNLPTSDQASALAQGGSFVRSAGWGATVSGGDIVDNFLVAKMTVVPDSICHNSDGTYKVGSVTYHGIGGAFQPAMMICAGGATSSGKAIDTCQGDSGGPLVSGAGASAVLIGVVSWGYGCAGFDEGKPITLTPGIYTRVGTYLPWLATQGIGGQEASAPGAPTGLTAAIASSTSVELTWKAPANTGGSAITGYVVEESVDGGGWEELGTTEGADTSVEITEMETGVAYAFRVAAINSAGAGAFSQPSAPITLPSESATAPGPVSGFAKGKFTKTGKTYKVTVTWSPPADDGGSEVTAYAARVGLASSWSDWADLEEPATDLMRLKPGKTYMVQVIAINAVGDGDVASYSVTTPRR